MTAADKPLFIPGQPRRSPLLRNDPSPGLPPLNHEPDSGRKKNKLPHYITGEYTSSGGTVFRVAEKLSWRDRFDTSRARMSGFRMKYRVTPGLYALGNPDEYSPVTVTANYKISFDLLRQSLAGIDAWILVLDTGGINVWCAAGKGTFGTGELIKRIDLTGLHRIVKGRSLILPQLGAPGVNAPAVKAATGFTIRFGPVMTRDLPAYFSSGMKKNKAMAEVPFSMFDRFVLVPMELNPAVKKFLPLALGLSAFFGLTQEGIIFTNALQQGGLFTLSLTCALITGTVLVPLLLPFFPGRSFAIKGAAAGILLTAALSAGGIYEDMDILLLSTTVITVPVISSYLALMFTGSTTFTSLSGVKKEMRYAVPAYIILLSVSAILLVIFKIKTWGLS